VGYDVFRNASFKTLIHTINQHETDVVILNAHPSVTSSTVSGSYSRIAKKTGVPVLLLPNSRAYRRPEHILFIANSKKLNHNSVKRAAHATEKFKGHVRVLPLSQKTAGSIEQEYDHLFGVYSMASQRTDKKHPLIKQFLEEAERNIPDLVVVANSSNHLIQSYRHKRFLRFLTTQIKIPVLLVR
jgi:hypothetical protein